MNGLFYYCAGAQAHLEKARDMARGDSTRMYVTLQLSSLLLDADCHDVQVCLSR